MESQTAKEPIKPSAADLKAITEKKKKRGRGQTILIPILAVITGLLIGAIVVIVTSVEARAAWGNLFSDPLGALSASWKAVASAYGSLFTGALGDPGTMWSSFQQWVSTGDSKAFVQSIYPLTESLTATTPFIIAGLALAIGFIAGLFNIGAEGQFLMGALASAFIGYSIVGLPWFLHLPLALIAGAVGGALWAFLPGLLKATVGAHEVVTTIMMNYISYALSLWLLNGPMMAPGYRPVTPLVEDSAMLPRFFPDPLRFNVGFFLALAVAVFIWWLLFKTTLGFEIRAVGHNPNAAKYAGVNIVRNTVVVMLISGGLAGLAGATQVLGVDHWVSSGYSSGYGFNSIAVALLGNSHPFGVVLAALLFGVLTSGATRMQSMAGIPIDIIAVIQGLVIIFVAAPGIVRAIYRIRASKKEGPALRQKIEKPASTSESTKP